MLRGLALCALTAPCALGLACLELKHADDAVDGGAEGGAPSDDAGGPGGDGSIADAQRDVGQPPTDVACLTDAWTKATKSSPDCARRRVFVVDPEVALDARRVSIARTPAGRIGIVYNALLGADEGEMRLVHFVPSTPTFTPEVIKRAGSAVDIMGADTRVVGAAPDVLHVLSHDVDSGSASGAVVTVRLTNGTPPLSNPDLIASGVPGPTELGFAIDSTGTMLATMRVKSAVDGGSSAKLVAYRKSGSGPFTAMQDLATGLDTSAAPHIGETSFFVTPGDQPNVVYHYAVSSYRTFGRFHTLDNDVWSGPKSLDNVSGGGVFGYSPCVTIHGTRKIVTYIARKAGQAPPAVAELKIARWQQTVDNPTIESLDAAIPAADPTNPQYRVAAAIDKFGLEHVALIRLSSSTSTTGALYYTRQTRSANGDTKWLTDTVDPDMLDGTTVAWVDMIVDDDARPHIAYRSGKDGLVRYATRFDR